MKTILLSGGSGFIGRVLVGRLLKEGYEVHVLTRNPQAAKRHLPEAVFCHQTLEEINQPMNAIVNLAGEPLLKGRWNDKRKKLFLESRVGTTQKLVEFCRSHSQKPEVFISGSAIGFYGAQDATPLDENATPHPEFTHDLCKQWENAAKLVEAQGIRLCIIRTGIVLGKNGGALKEMLLPFKLGLGGPVGSGKQYMSWIHMQDMVGLILFLLSEKKCAGVFNATAPHPVTNHEFTKTLAAVLKRPCLLPMPAFVMKLMFGEMAHILLTGQRVIPKHLQESGYQFLYPDVKSALVNLLKTRDQT